MRAGVELYTEVSSAGSYDVQEERKYRARTSVAC
jgi:hypothetical protein